MNSKCSHTMQEQKELSSFDILASWGKNPFSIQHDLNCFPNLWKLWKWPKRFLVIFFQWHHHNWKARVKRFFAYWETTKVMYFGQFRFSWSDLFFSRIMQFLYGTNLFKDCDFIFYQYSITFLTIQKIFLRWLFWFWSFYAAHISEELEFCCPRVVFLTAVVSGLDFACIVFKTSRGVRIYVFYGNSIISKNGQFSHTWGLKNATYLTTRSVIQ